MVELSVRMAPCIATSLAKMEAYYGLIKDLETILANVHFSREDISRHGKMYIGIRNAFA